MPCMRSLYFCASVCAFCACLCPLWFRPNQRSEDERVGVGVTLVVGVTVLVSMEVGVGVRLLTLT